MSAFATAGAGFLLAVLWFDLMFDVQLRSYAWGDVPEPVLASISAYYRRVTTAARPMNRLIAAVMLATVAALVAEVAGGDGPAWVGWVSLVLAVAAVGRAGTHTVPSAVRLGAAVDPAATRGRLARSIYRDHVACFAAILSVLVLQLARGA